jgi:hypothetical protein
MRQSQLSDVCAETLHTYQGGRAKQFSKDHSDLFARSLTYGN